VYVVAVGKAAPFMAAACAAGLPAPPRSGLVVGTHCPIALPEEFSWLRASHPVPDASSETAARRTLELARGAGSDEVVLVLVSGGASALLALPRAGVSLPDKQATVRQLLLAGADIASLNTVRKHLSAVKGGQLAAAVRGRTVALVVSDVVGDDLSVIGSGPTTADPTTFGQACAILDRCGGISRFPASVVEFLRRGADLLEPETPKPGCADLARAETRLIGTRLDAVRGAAEAARSLGYRVVVRSDPVVGEARDAGGRLAREAMSQAGPPDSAPVCLLSSGETTVTVTGAGRGGRNQELALATAQALEGWQPAWALLSAGTDGIDGPTDAAGAIADSTTVVRARASGLDLAGTLRENASYPFFRQLSDLVTVGPTDTNVGDVQALIVAAGDSQRARWS